MRNVMLCYDIPTTVEPKDYPEPSSKLRRFAVRIQFSTWILAESELPRADEAIDAIKAVGGVVDTVRYDESEWPRIKLLAKRSLEREVERIRIYVDKSMAKTREKLVEAETMVSVNDVNAAIRYQQTALNRALREIGDAEECSVAFDLTGDLSELTRAVRASIDARAMAFASEKGRARAVVRATAATTVTFGEGQTNPDQTNLPGVGE